MSVMVARVSGRRRRGAPDRRASGRIGDHHAVAEQLRDELDISRLPAACTGTGKLHKRLSELAVLDRTSFKQRALIRNLADRIAPVWHLFLCLCRQFFHNKRFWLRRADVRTVAAAGTVHRTNLHTKVKVLKPFAPCLLCPKRFWRCCFFLRIQQKRPYTGMRADKRTLVALDTRLYIPLRHIDRDAALFIGRRTVWKRTVLDAAKSTDRKRVTLLAVHRAHHLRYKRRLLDAVLRFVLPVVFTKLLPVIRHFDSLRQA